MLRNMKIDELKADIQRTEDIKGKLDLYNELVAELQKIDLPHAIQVCEEAIGIAHQSGNDELFQEEIANCLLHLGMLHARSGKYLKAISVIYDALPQIEKTNNSYLHARAINVIAASNGYLGNYYEALNLFMKALEIFKEIGDKLWEAAILNNIAYQYWHLENYDWALKYLNMSLSQVEKLDDKNLEGDVCETLCNVYLSQKNYEKSLKFGNRSIVLYQETGDKHGESEVLNSLGDVYKALNQDEKALDCYQQALKLSKDIGHQHEEVETLVRMGKFYTDTSNTETALEMLKTALCIAEELGTKRSMYECHRALSHYYKKEGEFATALNHFENYDEIYREVFDLNEGHRIQSLEIMHQVENARKDAEIYRLKNVALQNEIDERIRAQDALKELAMTDQLTHLYNRHYFFELADEEFQRAKVIETQLSIILIDVDNFKAVNDSYGHVIGDKVLTRLAKIMQDSLRKGDIIARYGGEEFVVLLPNTSLKQAKFISERLRATVANKKIQIADHQIGLGVSVGIAFYDGQPEISLETLLNRADLSMYEAKEAGGNRVHIWGSGML